jgi:hypothetical protein
MPFPARWRAIHAGHVARIEVTCHWTAHPLAGSRGHTPTSTSITTRSTRVATSPHGKSRSCSRAKFGPRSARCGSERETARASAVFLTKVCLGAISALPVPKSNPLYLIGRDVSAPSTRIAPDRPERTPSRALLGRQSRRGERPDDGIADGLSSVVFVEAEAGTWIDLEADDLSFRSDLQVDACQWQTELMR